MLRFLSWSGAQEERRISEQSSRQNNRQEEAMGESFVKSERHAHPDAGSGRRFKGYHRILF